QQDLSNRFATWPVDRFAGLPWQAGAGGAPLFPACCASFEVANETAHLAGDHTIFIGRVEKFSETPDLAPLLFHAGQYRHLATL
ncbi:MAG: flavin reductase family protein, partial [Azonexus sp.]|nr:flavin reductase family protein [Azonexus sp.]